MEALLQTTKSQEHHGGRFESSTPYQQMQAAPLPEFRRPNQSAGSYGAKDHATYMSPDGAAVAHGQSEKNIYDTDQPVASIETPRSILCTPPSTIAGPSVGLMTNISSHNEPPLSTSTPRAAIDKEESILSPDNVVTRPFYLMLLIFAGQLGTPWSVPSVDLTHTPF